jgi:hypothetical protein
MRIRRGARLARLLGGQEFERATSLTPAAPRFFAAQRIIKAARRPPYDARKSPAPEVFRRGRPFLRAGAPVGWRLCRDRTRTLSTRTILARLMPRATRFIEFTIVPTSPRKTTSVSARSSAGDIKSLFLFACLLCPEGQARRCWLWRADSIQLRTIDQFALLPMLCVGLCKRAARSRPVVVRRVVCCASRPGAPRRRDARASSRLLPVLLVTRRQMTG